MSIRFICPHCRQVMTVEDRLADKGGRCPTCKAKVACPFQQDADPWWSTTSSSEQPTQLPPEQDESITLEVADDDAPLGIQPPQPSFAQKLRQWFAGLPLSFYAHIGLILGTILIVVASLQSTVVVNFALGFVANFTLVAVNLILCLGFAYLCDRILSRLFPYDDEDDDEDEEGDDDEDPDSPASSRSGPAPSSSRSRRPRPHPALLPPGPSRARPGACPVAGR